MISEKMMNLGKKSSVIREIFEYGKKRKAEIGAENVFDFSLGNPSVPAPEEVTEIMKAIYSIFFLCYTRFHTSLKILSCDEPLKWFSENFFQLESKREVLKYVSAG